jgi:hypothetical protein
MISVVARRSRKTLTQCILIHRSPELVFDALCCVGNLSQWSWFHDVTPVDANLYQAEGPEGACRFFWIEDKKRMRLVLHHTGHEDSPCLVLSVSGSGGVSLVHCQYSSHNMSTPCRQHITQQTLALKQWIESAPVEAAK